MGVVHLAQGPDGKRVALKVLRPHVVGDGEARERLAREVNSLKRVSSPRIAEILDADPHGPVPFVVTRYVPGLSLYHHVAEEGPIEGADLLHFADALAEALQAVHSVGVLHRDIKPTNVLMEGRSPVLIDFGLARVAEDPRLTQTGWLLGTPGYLAPEILYGDDATVASDVHAWAATVVFAATGRPPYGTGPAMAIMDRVRRGEHDLSGVPETAAGGCCASASPRSRWSGRPCASCAPRSTTCASVRTSPRGRQPEPELWTMPFAPRPPPLRRGPTADTDELPLTGRAEAAVPVSRAPDACRAPNPSARPCRPTRILPRGRTARPTRPRPNNRSGASVLRGPTRRAAGPSSVLQLLGLGALTSAVVAYAPYAGTAVVAHLVLLLRTASVTRQRHGRRRMVRGRPRWYDVPTTTLATPGYLLLAFFGALSVVAVASLSRAGDVLARLPAGQPVDVGLVMAGLGFTPACGGVRGRPAARDDPRAGDADRPLGVRRLVRDRHVPAGHGRAARAAVQRRAQLGARAGRPLALSGTQPE